MLVEVECSLCRRHGRYRLARLAERHSAAIELGPLLAFIAGRCGLAKLEAKPRQYEARCGVRYRVPAGGPLPEGVPAREARPGEVWPPRPRRLGPQGPLPTVGGTLAEGPRGMLVHCLACRPGGWRCHHQGRVDLATLKLPAEMPYAHIPRARVLRCSRCGSREVDVRPDWPSPSETQARRMSGGRKPVQVLNGIVVPVGGELEGGPNASTPTGSTPPR